MNRETWPWAQLRVFFELYLDLKVLLWVGACLKYGSILILVLQEIRLLIAVYDDPFKIGLLKKKEKKLILYYFHISSFLFPLSRTQTKCPHSFLFPLTISIQPIAVSLSLSLHVHLSIHHRLSIHPFLSHDFRSSVFYLSISFQASSWPVPYRCLAN